MKTIEVIEADNYKILAIMINEFLEANPDYRLHTIEQATTHFHTAWFEKAPA